MRLFWRKPLPLHRLRNFIISKKNIRTDHRSNGYSKICGNRRFFQHSKTRKELSGVTSIISNKPEGFRLIGYKDIPDITCNAQLSASLIDQFCPLDHESVNLLRKAAERFHYSGRAIHKYMKIARTIADLEGDPSINVYHMKKSLLSRDLEKDSHTLQQRG